MDDYFNILNNQEVIQKSIPNLIETFVGFYGEENREHITNMFNSIILIGYQDISDRNVIITKIEEEKTSKLISELFQNNNIEFNDNNIKKYFGYSKNLTNYQGTLISKISEFIDLYKQGPVERLKNSQHKKYEMLKNYIKDLDFDSYINGNITQEQVNLLPGYIRINLDYYVKDFSDAEKDYDLKKKDICSKIGDINPLVTYENVEQMISDGSLSDLEKLCSDFKETVNEFNDYIKLNLESIIDKTNNDKNNKEKCFLDNYKKYISEFKDLLNEKDRLELEKGLQSGRFFSVDGLKVYLGSSLNSNKLIDSFSQENELGLNNPDRSSYFKDNIISERINFFKYHGIDLGNDYEQYKNNPECQKIWPSQELIDRINSRCDYYKNQANIDFYTSLDEYKSVMSRIDSIGLLDKDIPFQPSAFTEKLTCVSPNLVERNGTYQLCNLLLVYGETGPDADKKLIHELNHLYELSLSSVNNNSYEVICGWDIIKGNFNQDSVTLDDTVNVDNEKRDYELFSEIINELIAQKISKGMHDNGIYVLNSEGNTYDTGGTGYQSSKFLVSDFFEKYFDEIIASRKNGNIQVIFDKVGKDNFDQLNNLFQEFNESFPALTFYNLMDDLKNGKDSSYTRKYKEIVAKRDMILDSMNEYSMSNQNAL